MTELTNEKGVSRRAPTTPGVLNTCECISYGN